MTHDGKSNVIEFKKRPDPAPAPDARKRAQIEILDKIKAQIEDGTYTGFMILLGNEEQGGDMRRFYVVDSALTPANMIALLRVSEATVLSTFFNVTASRS